MPTLKYTWPRIAVGYIAKCVLSVGALHNGDNHNETLSHYLR